MRRRAWICPCCAKSRRRCMFLICSSSRAMLRQVGTRRPGWAIACCCDTCIHCLFCKGRRCGVVSRKLKGTTARSQRVPTLLDGTTEHFFWSRRKSEGVCSLLRQRLGRSAKRVVLLRCRQSHRLLKKQMRRSIWMKKEELVGKNVFLRGAVADHCVMIVMQFLERA